MDRPLSHDAAAELLGAYALNAVDPAEAAAVEAHLGTCTSCRHEIARLQTAGALAGPARRRRPSCGWDRRPPQPPAQEQDPIPGPGRPTLVAAEQARRCCSGRRRGGRDHGTGGRSRPPQPPRQPDGGGPWPRTSPGCPPGPSRPGVETDRADRPDRVRTLAEVVIDDSGTAFLLNQGLPALPAGRTYQLWILGGPRPVSLGLLGSDPATVAFAIGPARRQTPSR